MKPPCTVYSCKTYTEKYLFFDFECTQETGKHEPNLCIVHDFDGNEKIFQGPTTLKDFGNWLFSHKHKHYTAIAHNAKGYDSVFLLKHYIETSCNVPYVISNGTNLMLLSFKSHGIRVIDSMSFVAQALSEFPKTFGLKEFKKGYFPHYFNTEANQNYIGQLPDKEYYGHDQMKPKRRDEFLNWYEHNKGLEFDFNKELVEYCRSDVDILRKSCLDIANIDPFQYVTIASVCMAVYRSKYLKENTTAVVKNVISDQYSESSVQWMDFLMHKRNINIQHALNGKEKIINNR